MAHREEEDIGASSLTADGVPGLRSEVGSEGELTELEMTVVSEVKVTLFLRVSAVSVWVISDLSLLAGDWAQPLCQGHKNETDITK